ncbi:hypothetical protein E1301_Tti023262 [Triplophysa tibetana]|uniref:Immunoglobulin subtype domain-containing protein n=1 Tax=Triplophysa tibetana TaxID=1572043 RepID=A0A5A9NW43_9TELE|nr:hypothetical protein E1301_Tti023262 [Triplophysa tibetana]
MEGDSVTLHINTAEIQRDDLIMCGYQSSLKTFLVRINREDNTVSVNADDHDGMFRDRLQVDDQTGDLTITNITTQHSGLYQLIISGKEKNFNGFKVTVYEQQNSTEKLTQEQGESTLTSDSNSTLHSVLTHRKHDSVSNSKVSSE